jgi:hypothetical protein
MRLACCTLIIFGASSLGFAQQASDNAKPAKPLFVKAQCDGQLSSGVLTSFKQAILDSKQFVIASRLDEFGLNRASGYISMVCTERSDTVAVASVYGTSSCLGPNDCRAGIDGRSLSVALCDGKSSVDCGKQLYQHLVDWLHSPATKFVEGKK